MMASPIVETSFTRRLIDVSLSLKNPATVAQVHAKLRSMVNVINSIKSNPIVATVCGAVMAESIASLETLDNAKSGYQGPTGVERLAS